MKKIILCLVSVFLLLTSFAPKSAARAEEFKQDSGQFAINYDGEAAAILGGRNIYLDVNSSVGAVVEWAVLDNSTLEIVSATENYAEFRAVGEGLGIVEARWEDKKAYAYIPIIDATRQSGELAPKIIAQNEKVGGELTFVFTVGGYTKIINFVGNWEILSNGELLPFESIDNTAVIFEAKKGDYKAKLNSVAITEISAEYTLSGNHGISFSEAALPLAAVLMVLLLIVIIALKHRGTIYERQEKTLTKLENAIQKAVVKLENKGFSKTSFVKELIAIRVIARGGMGEIELVNLDGYGQMQTMQTLYADAIKCLDASIVYVGFTKDSALKLIAVFKKRFCEGLRRGLATLKDEIGSGVAAKNKPTDIDRLNIESENKRKKKNKNVINTLISDEDADD